MNQTPGVVPLNLHCPVEEAVSIENNDNANESHLESKNDSTDECDSTDSDESETTRTDSCGEKSVAETDSCTQSRKSSKSSTSNMKGTQKKWLVGRTSNRFYRILRFFGRQKQKLFPVDEIPEENEFEETKSTISRTKKDRSVSRTRNETGIDSRNVWGHDCERSTESSRSSKYSTFQRSEGSLVSKKVICCSTCSSPMVIHEIILANPPKISITPQNSRAGDETVSVEVSEKSLPENQENSKTYIMEKSESSGVISDGTENSTPQLRHSVETLENKSEISEVCKDSNIFQNVINVFESLQITSNEGSEIVERDSTPDDHSPSEQEFHKPVDCEEPECETKIDDSSGNMTYSDSEKVIAKIDYTEEISLASMMTTTTTSTQQLDKDEDNEENAVDTEGSEQTIVENQFTVSDQSMEGHNAIMPRTFDRYYSFKKKYIPVRSNCDTSSSSKSRPNGGPSNSRTTPSERTEYLFYPKKFCDPLETNNTHTVMWVSHHHPQENLRKIDEKNREIMEHLTNLKKTRDNSMKYCAPKDILEMTLGKYKSNIVSVKDFQNKLHLLDTKYNQNKTDSIQNIYLNSAFHDHLKSNEYFRDEYDFPTDIKINGVVYRQFDREYIPIKLKSEYKWKLFARRTIYSRSRKSVHSSKYSRTPQRNKEKSRNSRELVSSRSRKRIVCDKKCKNRIKSPSNVSRVSLTESANDEEDCRTLKEQLSKISICLSDYSD